jgi:hypothetical protein
MGYVIKVDFVPAVKTRKLTSIERREKKIETVDDRIVIEGQTEIFKFGTSQITWTGIVVWVVILGIVAMAIWGRG